MKTYKNSTGSTLPAVIESRKHWHDKKPSPEIHLDLLYLNQTRPPMGWVSSAVLR